MADGTHISWSEATWNPITGCDVLTPGCTNCYAMRLAGTRLKDHPSRAGLTRETKTGPVWNGKVRFNEEWLTQPLRWRKPRMIFVVAHGDLFYEAVPDEWIDRVFAVMALCPQHTFQVLTKRSERQREYIESLIAGKRGVGEAAMMMGVKKKRMYDISERVTAGPLPNVWLGVSVEDQERANERIPHLLGTPAAVRWISVEPLLGPIDLEDWLTYPCCNGDQAICGCDGERGGVALDWVVAGGESAQNKPGRPMHPDWARSLRDQCVADCVPFHFKQWGDWIPWEPDGAPLWRSQHGRLEDRHALFPTDFDKADDWDDGLWAIGEGVDHAAFQRVGARQAGRLLDGREWNEYPRVER